MGLIERFAGWAGYEKRAASELSCSALAPGIGYYTDLSARAAENLSTVLACTNAIDTALAYCRRWSIAAMVKAAGRDADAPDGPDRAHGRQ